jgi:hypothetical protein
MTDRGAGKPSTEVKHVVPRPPSTTGATITQAQRADDRVGVA